MANLIDVYIVADNKSITYGDNLPSLTYSITFSDNIDHTSDIVIGNNPISINGNITNYVVNTYTISIDLNEFTIDSNATNNYNFISTDGILTVSKKALLVSADNKTINYSGSTFNNYTVSYSGFVNNETYNDLSGTLSFSGDSQTAIVPGTYSIIPSGYSSDNYLINYHTGNLIINKASLSITVDNKSFTYNGSLFNGNCTVSYSGFVNNETSNDLIGTINYSGTYLTAINAGIYTIIANGQTSTNYNITYNDGTLTIIKASLTITADNKTKDYNGIVYSGTNSITLNGFVNNETISVLSGSISYSGTFLTGTSCGDYTIIPSGYSSNNYDITYINGKLTINKVTLTVTAVNKSKSYDGNVYSGSYSVTYSGFVSNETSTVLGGTLSYGGTSQTGINAGTYDITPSGLTSSNYLFNYVNGTLTINKVNLTVLMQSTNRSFVYGSSIDYSQFYILTGFVNSETSSVVSGTAGIYVNNSPGLSTYTVGTYSNVVINNIGTLTATNYSFVINTTSRPNLIITKAVLSITPKSPTISITYGDAVNFNNFYDLTGFVNGDTISVINTTNTYHPTIILYKPDNTSMTYVFNQASSPLLAITYSISIGDTGNMASTNYSFIVSNPSSLPTLTVSKLSISVSINTSYQPYYGDSNIPLTILNNILTFPALKYNDIKTNIGTGNIKFVKTSDSSVISSSTLPGTYNINMDLSDYTCNNYNITLKINNIVNNNYNLTIQKAVLTVRPKNITTTLNYGVTLNNTQLADLFEVVGFVNNDGDQSTVCSGVPVFYLQNLTLGSGNVYWWTGNIMPYIAAGYGIYINGRGTFTISSSSNYSTNYTTNNSIMGRLNINKISLASKSLQFTWDKYLPSMAYGDGLTKNQLNASAPLNPYTNTPIGTITYYGINNDTQTSDNTNFIIGGKPNVGIYTLTAIMTVTDTNFIYEQQLYQNINYPINIVRNYPILTHYDPLPIAKNSAITTTELSATTNTSNNASDITYEDENGNEITAGTIITNDMIITEKLNNYSNTNFIPKYTFRKMKLYTI